MPQFVLLGSDIQGYSWELRDQGDVLGVSARQYPDPWQAALLMTLAAADREPLKPVIGKGSDGQYTWTVEIAAVPFARNGSPFSNRSVCSKSAARFVAAVKEAEIPKIPQRPRAVFAAKPAESGEPFATVFDGSASHASGSSIESYAWDFADGTRGVGDVVTHRFSGPGIYEVTLTVTNAAGLTGSLRQSIHVTDPEPEPTTDLDAPPLDHSGVTRMHDAVRFLYAGAGCLQQGMQDGVFEPHRVAVVRGRILAAGSNGEASPLPDVAVSVRGRPELGQTVSRSQGAFDLVVNGGATLTLVFEKDGYFQISRRVEVPWEEYCHVADVILSQREHAATNSVKVQAQRDTHSAVGHQVKDDHGSRRAAVILPGKVKFQTTGTESEEPVSLGLDLHEFTQGPAGPSRMPAQLPPSSGYTYAVDLSVQGRDSTVFTTPVAFYVDNFLGFPVGSSVPAGYFDAVHDSWLPSDNGRVIKILASSGSGVEIDIDGKGAASPQKLRNLGISESETAELGKLYQAGQSLWRVTIPHFSAWDLNWPYGPPADAVPPNAADPHNGDQEGNTEDPDTECGSTIRIQSQVLGESVPLTGTRFTLCYSSDRCPGRKAGFTLQIPLSGSALPSSVKGIELEISVAGQKTERHFEPAPNLQHVFRWNGRDGTGACCRDCSR